MQKVVWLWPITLFLSTLAVLFFVLILPGTAIQPWIVMWFLIICPGMAWVRLLKTGDLIVELTLGIAVGLSLDAIVVVLFLYARAWSLPAMLIVLSLLCLLGVGIQSYQLMSKKPLGRAG